MSTSIGPWRASVELREMLGELGRSCSGLILRRLLPSLGRRVAHEIAQFDLL